jgi:hypothetical protein
MQTEIWQTLLHEIMHKKLKYDSNLHAIMHTKIGQELLHEIMHTEIWQE